MATKARFYEVERQNGHETQSAIIAAPSREQIESTLNTKDIKVNKVKFLGWAPVTARPDECEIRHEFNARVNGQEVTIHAQTPGFDYLNQQFPAEVQDVISFLNESK
ncbi:hypothetical protein [Rhodoferax sp. GW822-FHT02A01]|uniref:hypothetical protein n=1 Tax=Rhodoferax sp. GW822-FHT02A01 TaxID=3141537 RepID=UPI00315D0E05